MKRLLAGVMTVALSACGGGSGQPGTVAAGIDGKVIDGYLSGAVVFWDCNGNGVADADERTTVSRAGGAFTIGSMPAAGCNLMAWVGPDAIDEDLPGVRGAWYTMAAIPGLETVITPLTTLVAGRVRAGVPLDQAQTEVAATFGLSGNLANDYLLAGAKSQATAARTAAQALQRQETATSATESATAAFSELKQRAADAGWLDAIASGVAPWTASYQSLVTRIAAVVQGNDALRVVRRISLPSATDNATLDAIAAKVNAQQGARYGQPDWNALSTADLRVQVAALNRMNANAGSSAEGVALAALQRQRNALFADAAAVLNRAVDYDGALSSAVDFFASDPLATLDYAVASVAISAGIASDVVILGTPNPQIRKPKKLDKDLAKLVRQTERFEYLASAVQCSRAASDLGATEDVASKLVQAVVACGGFLAEHAGDLSKALKAKKATPAFIAGLEAAGGIQAAAAEEDKLLAQMKAGRSLYGLVLGVFDAFVVDPVAAKLIAAGDLLLQFTDATIAAMELERAASKKLDTALQSAMARYNAEVDRAWRAYFVSYMELYGSYYFKVVDGSACASGQTLDPMGNCAPSGTAAVLTGLTVGATSLAAGTAVDFTLVGSDLPTAMTVTSTTCTGLPASTGGAFRCTPSGTSLSFRVANASTGAAIGQVEVRSMTVAGNAFPGVAFALSQGFGAASCTAKAAGTWSNGPGLTFGPGGAAALGNCGVGCRVPAAPSVALVMVRAGGAGELIGTARTFTLAAGESVVFSDNDSLSPYGPYANAYPDNTGSVSLLLSCTAR